MTDRKTQPMPLHQALARALMDHGIGTIFGLIGDANLFMVDSFIKKEGGRFVAAAHEAAAVLMAHGYAQTTARTAVATVTHGPGLTNALTALVEAVRSGTPLLILGGDTPTAERDHIQKIDQRELILACGAGFEQIRTAETALEDLARAFRRASLERRPVVLNMPVDYQWLEVPYQKVVFGMPHTVIAPAPSDDFDNAIGIIAAAERPVVLAGRGAIGARQLMIDLAKRIEAPLATTLRASGLFNGEPTNLGVFGTLSTPIAADVILESDCVVAFGAGLNFFTAARGAFLRDKRVIQVDVDPQAIGWRARPKIGVVGDAALVAKKMIELLDEAEIPASQFASPAMMQKLASYEPEPVIQGFKGDPAPDTIDLRMALLHLGRALPLDRNVVTDLGRFVSEAWKAFPVANPLGIIHTVSFGSVGLGLGSAIGAAANGGRPTVLICGDGGFMMSGFAELNTAVRENLDLIVIVCSDRSYGAEHEQFHNRSMDPATSVYAWPDFAPVGEAMGFRSMTVRNADDLEIAAAAITSRDRPVLIDLKLDPDRIPWEQRPLFLPAS